MIYSILFTSLVFLHTLSGIAGKAPVSRGKPRTTLTAQAVERATQSSIPLAFHDFFEPSSKELKPSAKLLALNGKRVRLVGFMAQLEIPIKGAFYLCPRPVICDEAGGGTADLPPESVLVIMRSAKGKEVGFVPGALQMTGILEIGSRIEEEGQVSYIRLILDRPQDLPRQHGTQRHSRMR